MKPIIKKLILGAVASVILLLGVANTTAQAQDKHHRYPRGGVYGPYYPIYDPFYPPVWDPFWGPRYKVLNPVAYEQEWGYREGRYEGMDDAKDGRPANPAGTKDYYKSDSYAYRQAFVQGYFDGYRKARWY